MFFPSKMHAIVSNAWDVYTLVQCTWGDVYTLVHIALSFEVLEEKVNVTLSLMFSLKYL